MCFAGPRRYDDTLHCRPPLDCLRLRSALLAERPALQADLTCFAHMPCVYLPWTALNEHPAVAAALHDPQVGGMYLLLTIW